jgi:hypothetical protein
MVTHDPIREAKAATARGDDESAITVLRPLAEAGNRDAQYELGFLALTECESISGREAFSLFMKAAQDGHWWPPGEGRRGSVRYSQRHPSAAWLLTLCSGPRRDLANRARSVRLSAFRREKMCFLGLLVEKATKIHTSDSGCCVVGHRSCGSAGHLEEPALAASSSSCNDRFMCSSSRMRARNSEV